MRRTQPRGAVMRISRRVFGWVACGLLAILAGCGGGGGEAGTVPDPEQMERGVSVTVHWPQPTGRVIPNSAERIEISLTGNGLTLAAEPILRSDVQDGQATRRITGMPAGEYILTVVAKAEDGTVVAGGASDIEIPEGGLVSTTITLSHTAEGHPAVLAQGHAEGWTQQARSFQGSATDHGGSIVSYQWDFGDGTLSPVLTQSASATHQFTQPGTYVVTLTATDNDGLTGTAQVTIEIHESTIEFVRFYDFDGQTVPTDSVHGIVLLAMRILTGAEATGLAVKVDGTAVGQASASADGLWGLQYDAWNLADGPHTMLLEASLCCGQGSFQHELTFTVANVGTPTGTTLNVQPQYVTLAPGAQQRFRTDIAANWVTLEPRSTGTIDAGGLYTAPQTPGVYLVRAYAQNGSTCCDFYTAWVTVLPPEQADLIVNPVTATLRAGEQLQYRAAETIEGASGVDWSTTGGAITANGLYTAPGGAGVFQVTATSRANPGRSESVTVAVCTAGTGPDGAEMIDIPAGTFTMGSVPRVLLRSIPPWPEDKEFPQRQIELAAYRVHTDKVTNARYAAFLNAAQPSDAVLATWVTFDDGSRQKLQRSGNVYRVVAGFEDAPVAHITWFGAQAYAEQYGMMLPTEAQWEKAARGALDARAYPWGFTLPGYSNSPGWDEDLPWTSKSPWGVDHTGTGPAEWCRDWFSYGWYSVMPSADPYNETPSQWRSVRAAFNGWLAYRSAFPPDWSDLTDSIGFRCVAAR